VNNNSRSNQSINCYLLVMNPETSVLWAQRLCFNRSLFRLSSSLPSWTPSSSNQRHSFLLWFFFNLFRVLSFSPFTVLIICSTARVFGGTHCHWNSHASVHRKLWIPLYFSFHESTVFIFSWFDLRCRYYCDYCDTYLTHDSVSCFPHQLCFSLYFELV